MISVLLVAAAASPLSPPASIELLRCATPEQALEILSRNRRIDAVLFFEDSLARDTGRLLGEEGESWPPLFLAGQTALRGVEPLDPGSIFEDLSRRLGE